MKFSKVAIATAAVLAASAVHAQTANVTLYGGLRLALESATYKGPAGSARITSLENISSRWGMRGSESLGGGMSAIFQLESGFAADTGANGVSGGVQQIFSREAWVGLSGGFGTVRLGYGLTPYDDVLGWAHHQGANSWENRNNGVSGGAGFAKRDLFTNYVNTSGCASTAFDARYGNSLSYATPDMGGFSVRTQYALLGEATSNSCTGWDTAFKYNKGPITAGVAYAMHRNFTSISSAAHNDDALRAYVGYNFGIAKIDGTYETARYKLATGTLKYKYWELGALVPAGAWTLGVQYSQRDKGLAALYNPLNQTLAGIVTGARWDNGGGKHLSLTADYALSKRTTLRGYYTQLQNEATLTNTTATGVFAGKAKINALSLGLWHSF